MLLCHLLRQRTLLRQVLLRRIQLLWNHAPLEVRESQSQHMARMKQLLEQFLAEFMDFGYVTDLHLISFYSGVID